MKAREENFWKEGGGLLQGCLKQDRKYRDSRKRKPGVAGREKEREGTGGEKQEGEREREREPRSTGDEKGPVATAQ